MFSESKSLSATGARSFVLTGIRLATYAELATGSSWKLGVSSELTTAPLTPRASPDERPRDSSA